MKKEAKTKTTKTPQIYLRASAWRTWQACALSLIIKDETPFTPEPDEFAAEGTRIHAAIEADLKFRTEPAKTFPRATLDVEQEAIVNFAVRATMVEAGGNPFTVETKFETTTAGVRQVSRVDTAINEPETLAIVDYKTGWKIVEAQTEINGKIVPDTQLKMGAHLGRKPHHKYWRGIIINARMNTISMTGPHPFEKDYLKNIAADAKKRVAAKQTLVGNHCAYCPALMRCEPLRAAIKKWIVPGADDGLKNRKDDWSEVLNLIKPFENLAKRAKSDALKYLELGGEIPGVSLELTGGTRAWPRDLSEKELAARLGVSVEKITTRETVSPKQAEEKGIDREKIKALAIQPLRRGLKVSVAKKEKAS